MSPKWFKLAACLWIGGLPAGVQGAQKDDTSVASSAERSAETPDAKPSAYGPFEVVPLAPQPTPAALDREAADEENRLTFNFRFQPWKDVLDWFAEQADLSLVMDSPPPGTFNYQDSRSYTPAEAIDLLNGVLLTKGYTLVRRERMLMLVNIEDGIPANLVPTVSLDELEEKGRFELVSVVFRPVRMTPEEAEAEIKKLLGPQGSAVVLSRAGQILVTDTAGRLRTIHSILQAVDEPAGLLTDGVSAFPVKHVAPEDAVKIIKQLLGMAEDQNATADGSLRIAIDGAGRRILANGKSEAVRRVGEIIKTLDVPVGGELSVNQSLQLEVYPIVGADPATVLQVMQTLLAGRPDVRLTTDSLTGNLVALGRASDHATISATLDQMQGGKAGVTRLGNLRIVPITGRSAQSVLEQVESIWPTMRKNKIRVVAPSAAISDMRIDRPEAPSRGQSTEDYDEPEDEFETDDQDFLPEAVPQAWPESDDPSGDDDTTSMRSGPRIILVQARRSMRRAAEDEEPAAQRAGDAELPPIIVVPSAGGITIASEDPEALDDFEELLTTLAGRAAGAGRQYTVFYLKYAKAQLVSELIGQIFSSSVRVGDTGSGSPGEAGRPAVTTVSAAAPVSIVPDTRLNALFVQAAPAEIDTIEQLLRVLDRQGSPEDVQLSAAPRLIPVQYTSAESVATVVRQVYADRMAQAGGGGQQRPGPEEFLQMMRGGRGRDGRDSGRRSQAEDTPRMTVGVDARTNALVVSAPDSLFNEVKALVAELDRPGESVGQSLSVVAIKRADPATLQKTLAAITGGAVQTSTSGSSTTTPGATTSSAPGTTAAAPSPTGQPGGFEEDMRRRMEFFQRMREGRGRDGGDRGRGRRSD